MDKSDSIFIVDSIMNKYEDFILEHKLNKNKLSLLNELFHFLDKSLKNQKNYVVLSQINKIEYLRVIDFLKMKLHSSLFKEYILDIDFNSHQVRTYYLNKLEASDKIYNKDLKDHLFYNKIVFNYLKENKHKSLDNLKNGLKNSSFYKQNKIKIDSLISVPTDISQKILAIKLHNYEKEVFQLYDFIQNKNKDYYLLEFWATWCAPCLEEINILKKKNIQMKNLEIVNLSLDKDDSFLKWTNKSKQLNLSNSYLVSDMKTNFETLKALEVNEIPRFILINKSGKVIKIDFPKPSSSNFEDSLLRITQKN
jgi:thiol-disulfide isomerase/thioredoxin